MPTGSPVPVDSTTTLSKSQAQFKVKALVYASLKNLSKFDSLIFEKMAKKAFPGGRKTVAEWDAFRTSYLNSTPPTAKK